MTGNTTTKLGFIGLGTMGRPMAINLLRAGYALTVFDTSQEAIQALAAEGAAAGESAKGVAQRAGVVLICVPDSPDVQAVMAGPAGVLQGLSAGKVVVDMSSISPVVARELARQVEMLGADMLDAPVSGGEEGARQGTLSIMVGGREAAFRKVLPILQVIGKSIVHIGDAGAGQVTKACNQLVVALTLEAVCEALVLAAKAGVEPVRVREALLGGFAQSRILDFHGKRILERNFEPGFKSRLQWKDLNIALETARAYQVPLPATGLVHEQYTALLATGKGDRDHAILVTLLEELAHLQVQDE